MHISFPDHYEDKELQEKLAKLAADTATRLLWVLEGTGEQVDNHPAQFLDVVTAALASVFTTSILGATDVACERAGCDDRLKEEVVNDTVSRAIQNFSTVPVENVVAGLNAVETTKRDAH